MEVARIAVKMAGVHCGHAADGPIKRRIGNSSSGVDIFDPIDWDTGLRGLEVTWKSR